MIKLQQLGEVLVESQSEQRLPPHLTWLHVNHEFRRWVHEQGIKFWKIKSELRTEFAQSRWPFFYDQVTTTRWGSSRITIWADDATPPHLAPCKSCHICCQWQEVLVPSPLARRSCSAEKSSGWTHCSWDTAESEDSIFKIKKLIFSRIYAKSNGPSDH